MPIWYANPLFLNPQKRRPDRGRDAMPRLRGAADVPHQHCLKPIRHRYGLALLALRARKKPPGGGYRNRPMELGLNHSGRLAHPKQYGVGSMNQIVTQNKQNLTMNSREIAALVESRHDNVRLSIERLAERGVIQLPPMQEVENNQATSPNSKSKVYVFSGEKGKRDSIIVVAQLSPEFTARLVDRWQELEAQVAKPALPDFSNPAEAARAWAAQFEQRAALEAKVEADAPKVAFYHDVTGSDAVIDMATVAKVLNRGIGRNRLFAFLREEGVLDGRNVPYQRFVDMGWFRLVETKWQKPNGDWQIGIKTVVFQRGVEGIARLLDKKDAA